MADAEPPADRHLDTSVYTPTVDLDSPLAH
jgi:hypothetical protein